MKVKKSKATALLGLLAIIIAAFNEPLGVALRTASDVIVETVVCPGDPATLCVGESPSMKTK